MKKNTEKPKGSFYRTCTGCGSVKNKYEMLRVVKSPDGTVFLDKTGKLPGRGAYVCNDTKCIEKALKSGKISRTLKTKIPEGLFDNYDKQ